MTSLSPIKKLIRTSRRLLLFALALAALILVVLVLSLDPLARRTVEKQTTTALNLRTTVGSVVVHPLTSRADFRDFRIASPNGFNTPDMLIVPSAEMGVSFSEFHKEIVHIKSITMMHPRLVIEGNGRTFNLKRMAEQIPLSLHPAHLVIDQVTVQDATVVLRNLPGIKGEVTVPVETFTMNGLGADHPGGAADQRGCHAIAYDSGGSRLRLPADARGVPRLIKGDLGQLVLRVITSPVGRLLSGLFGGHDSPAHGPDVSLPAMSLPGLRLPAVSLPNALNPSKAPNSIQTSHGNRPGGLFGFGLTHSRTTRPDE